MGYKLDYGALRSLAGTYGGAVSQWKRGLSAVMGQASSVAASTNISGNSADRLKEYLNTAYSCIETSLSILLSLFQENFLLYVDAYSQQVDAAGDAHIEEQELGNLHSRLEAQRHRTQQIAIAAESALQGVSDLVPLPIPDFDVTDTAFGTILTSVYQLNDAVNALESAHVSADFAQIDALIAGLDAHLAELCGQGRELKTAFSASGYAALASVPALLQAASDAYNRMAAQESSVAAAAERLENQLAREQAEMEKRKEQAEWTKVGVNVLVGLVSAVAIATTGPVGAIVVGTVSGAVSATFSAAADEYVKNGWDMSDWNTDRIVIHGCIGAVTGMIGGLVAPGAGSCAKAGIKGLSSAIEGVASSSYDQLESSGRITDVGGIARDAAIKGVGTFVGSLAGSAVSDKIGDAVKQNSTIKDLAEHVVGGKEHFGAVLQVEGASGLVSGAVKRFSSTAVKETGGLLSSLSEGKSFAEAYDEHRILSSSFEHAADIKEIVSDAGSAVSSAATDNPLYASEKKLEYYRSDDYYQFGDSPDLSGKKDGWKHWNSEEYDRMTESLRRLDEQSPDDVNKDIYANAKEFGGLRDDAVHEAWAQERRLVMQGRGTRDWTVSQQEELIRTGKVSGFEGSHMLDASSNPAEANNPDNIQFLTHDEHFYGAHNENYRNPTTGRFDPATGNTDTIHPRQLPHREQVAFELSNRFDYTQLDLAQQLGPSFGYGRGSDK